MLSPRERLKKIAESIIPQRLVYRPQACRSKDTLKLAPMTLQDLVFAPNDDALQEPLKTYFLVSNDRQHEPIEQRVDGLFRYVKEAVCSEYYSMSGRCSATKRKTADFVHKIPLDNTILSNFLLVLFVKSTGHAKDEVPSAEEKTMYETLESLRRVYGDQI